MFHRTFPLPRPVRQGVAPIRRQADREAQDPNIQVHPQPGLQRDLLLQRSLGEDQGVLPRRHGHGLRQHRQERAHWQDPPGW